ncbi:hypothetical protein D3C85_1570090 [compost metagenome]
MTGTPFAARAAGQRIGQGLAVRVEYPQVAQVGVARGEVQRHGQVHAVPGALAVQAQLDAGGEIIRLLGGEQRLAEQPQPGQQGQAGAP